MHNKKDFLSIAGLTSEQVGQLVESALTMKQTNSCRLLDGKIIALLFEKPSLRTKASFETGIRRLGGQAVYFGRDEVGLGVRESVADVAKVLERMFDGVVARVFAHQSLEEMAHHANIPIINALSDVEHPCQALGDLLTLREVFGELRGRRVVFVGDGNNVATRLGLACASARVDFVLSSPPAYRIPDKQWDAITKRADLQGSSAEWIENPHNAVKNADCVYTDVWASMGQESERSKRLPEFVGYQVSPKLMDGAKQETIFMHDMPAHEGEEISKGMLDHPRSVVFDQAENRLHAQKAILAWIFSKE